MKKKTILNLICCLSFFTIKSSPESENLRELGQNLFNTTLNFLSKTIPNLQTDLSTIIFPNAKAAQKIFESKSITSQTYAAADQVVEKFEHIEANKNAYQIIYGALSGFSGVMTVVKRSKLVTVTSFCVAIPCFVRFTQALLSNHFLKEAQKNRTFLKTKINVTEIDQEYTEIT